MRRLIITRGAQGLGKSSLVRALNLSSFTLCPDDLRGLWGAPLISEGGRWEVNHLNEPSVWRFLDERLSARMARGELVLIDATHTYLPGLERYAELCERYAYRGLCVDFSKRSLEEALAGNRRRPWRSRVPDAAVKRTWEASQAPLPAAAQRVFKQLFWEGEQSVAQARAWLRVEERSLSPHQADPLVLFGRAPLKSLAEPRPLEEAFEALQAAARAVEQKPDRPTAWLSPLHSALSDEHKAELVRGELSLDRLEALGRLLEELSARHPRLSLMRGPLEAIIPSWGAARFEDALRWMRAERCLDLHWAPLSLPPPTLALVSSAQLCAERPTEALSSAPSRALQELEGWREEWSAERLCALGERSSFAAEPLEEHERLSEWSAHHSGFYDLDAEFCSTTLGAPP